jgi:hypothetical protein
MSNKDRSVVEPDVCPACGSTFKCSTSHKCWCYEINVPAEVMAKIQDEFDGCLCSDCLYRISKSQTF